jgi:hypothetical protein
MGADEGDRVTLLGGIRVGGGILALLAAVSVALLAEDVRRWPDRIEAGDVRFAAGAGAENPWRTGDRLPLRLGDHLLAIDDDVDYRRALHLIRRLRAASVTRSTVFVQLLGRGEGALAGLERRQQDPRARAATANLLGLVYAESAQVSGAAAGDFRRGALATWERAVRLDPENADAKFNYEFLLALVRREEAFSTGVPFSRGRSRVGGTEAGSRPTGEGY